MVAYQQFVIAGHDKMLQDPLPPQPEPEILTEDLLFAALQVDAGGLIVAYDGIDLPDLGLRRRDIVGKCILTVWAEIQCLYDLATRLLAGQSGSVTLQALSQDDVPHTHSVFGSTVTIGNSTGVLIHAFQL